MSVKRSLKWLKNRSTGLWGQQFFARKHVRLWSTVL